MSEIIPAILPKDEKDLKEKVSNLPKETSLFHMDVLEEDTWAEEIKKDFEAHLMVREPQKIVDKWIGRGAKRIIAHELITQTTGVEAEIGLAVELHIPLEQIFPLVPQVNFIHLMSIAEIGAQGRPLDPQIFDRIRRLKVEFPEITISIDGGVSTENYQPLLDAGADRLIVGSHFEDLWNSLTKK